jgi:hypothetical protein
MQRCGQALLRRNDCHSFSITTAIQCGDSVGNIDFGVAELRSVGEVEDGLLRGGDQCRPEISLDPLCIERVGIALNELNDGGTVDQANRPMLFRHSDNGSRQGTRDRTNCSRRTDAHQDRVLRPVDGGSHAGGGCFQFGQPLAPHHVLGNNDVKADRYPVQHPSSGQARQLRTGVGVSRPGSFGANSAQQSFGELRGKCGTALIDHYDTLSMQILGFKPKEYIPTGAIAIAVLLGVDCRLPAFNTSHFVHPSACPPLLLTHASLLLFTYLPLRLPKPLSPNISHRHHLKNLLAHLHRGARMVVAQQASKPAL